MKRWFGAKAVTTEQFETQQDKLQRLSAEVVRRYQRELNAEISDPKRLEAMYGTSFSSAGFKRQAETVCLMATSMLKVPHCEVTIVYPDRQQSVAAANDYEIVARGLANGPIADSWCKHVIATGREFAIDDSTTHPLVCDTRLATSGACLSYLGVPIANPEGIIIGVLCCFDAQPRDWKTSDVSMLTQLSFVLTRAMNTPATADA